MCSHDELRNKALATYDAAADRYDDSDNTFWELFGRRTIARLGLRPGMHVSERDLRGCPQARALEFYRAIIQAYLPIAASADTVFRGG